MKIQKEKIASILKRFFPRRWYGGGIDWATTYPQDQMQPAYSLLLPYLNASVSVPINTIINPGSAVVSYPYVSTPFFPPFGGGHDYDSNGNLIEELEK